MFPGSGIIILLPLLHLAAATSLQGINYTQWSCNGPALFAANTTYATNLDTLLTTLSANLTTGFINSTSGDTSSTTVYGLVLCRGDVTTDFCTFCISMAFRSLREHCSGEKEAIIWQEWCMIRYANRDIFSSMEDDPYSVLRNVKSASGDAWMQVLTSTVKDVTSRAAASSGKKFATKEAAYTAGKTMYSMAQCTPDLTEDECLNCFQVAIETIPKDYEGGIALLPSCNLRYEIYPFYENYTVPKLPLSPAPTSVDAGEIVPLSSAPTSVDAGEIVGGKRKGSKSTLIVTVATVAPVVLLVLFSGLFICIVRRRKVKKKLKVPETGHGIDLGTGVDFTTVESLHFEFSTLQYATQNFSDYSKIGEGGFGGVYKGVLVNGREIAVKRLSKGSDQGEEEFKNEVVLLAKLQHRNLVRLLGFCLTEEEKLLVYEFVTNHSLDYFLFDPRKQRQLEWPTRFKIIGGIARGILYLHEDSRLKIIHRDLKASNILLDEAMNPKIADFGMARISGAEQTHDTTMKVAGTRGYMAPEYVMNGHYSTKSDAYSFGILVLEIVTGKKNSSLRQTGLAGDLPSYAWENWAEGKPLLIMDSTLKDISEIYRNEAKKCIHIGLLCIQKDVDKRPTMATIVHMLNVSSFETLPDPQQPDFFVSRMRSTDPEETVGSDQSRSKSGTSSTNDASISQLDPR